MNQLKNYIRNNLFKLLATVIVVGLQNATMLLVPFLIAHIINDGVIAGNMNEILRIGTWMFGVLLLSTFLGVYGSYLSARYASEFGLEMRKKMNRNIQTMTLDEVNSFGVSSLVTRMIHDTLNGQQMIVTFLQMIFPSPIMSIASIVLTYQVYPSLVWIPIGTTIIFMLEVIYIFKKTNPFIKQIQLKIDKMTLIIREYFVGIKIIRAFDKSNYEKKRLDRSFEDYAVNNTRINTNFALLTPLSYSLMTFSMMFIVALGSLLVMRELIQVGSITAAIEYSTTSIATLIMSSLVLFQIPKATASLRRIDEVVNFRTNLIDHDTTTKGMTSGASLVTFDNVTFRYGHAEKPVLDNITFTMNYGETFAIVGGTGSGKSTIAKLLMRLNDIEAGSISYKGENILNFSLEKLRSTISYVPQKAYLFSGTIESTIQFGNPVMTSEEFERAIKIAQAEEFINQQPDKENAHVAQGGSNFSGGQKQRLAIARALAKPADLYIFDDSFSALDFKTDADLRKALHDNLSNASLLIIAQRLSTIMTADKIIVIDDGRIVGEGTHNELIVSNQYYRELARSQNLLDEEETSNEEI